MCEYCNDHSGFKFRIKRNEDDIQSIWKEINGMKKWVIIAMATVILQGAIIVVSVFKG